MKNIPVCEPFLNGNEQKYVTDCMKTGWISSSGKYVKAFEDEFARYCDCKYGVAVCNGTVSLHLALKALGIGKGDEVIVPSFTMIASAFAVCYTGATPVFVDADKDTWNIDVTKIEEKISPRTKAIMPVHIFGNPCNMSEIERIAKKYGLFIIEDAAEAHGATYQGKKVGSFSDIASFSFFANKNITTGEGGMLVMNDEKYYDNCRYFKNMCFPLNGPRDYMHNDIGFNYRMSNIHAAIGLAQVEKADEYKNLRIRNNRLYKQYLKDTKGIYFQKDEENATNVCWMNAILLDPQIYGHTKEELISYLKENGVDIRLLFTGMHRQKSLLDFGCDGKGEYPVTDNLTKNGFYLPSASCLKEKDIAYICGLIKKFGSHQQRRTEIYSTNDIQKFEKECNELRVKKDLAAYKDNALHGRIVFSILLPTYNRADLIQRAIDSVLKQTFPYYELLIIDDASTDSTEELVRSIKDPRIKYIKHEVNKGQNPAYNTGLKLAQGEYIAFLDSDDEWLPTKLEEVYKKFLSDSELGLVYHLGGILGRGKDNSKISLQRPDYLEGFIEKEVLSQSYLTSPTMEVVKKSCFDVIGPLREDIKTSKDDDMNFLFVKHFKVGFIKKILGIYYLNSNNRLGDNRADVAYGWWQLYENHAEDFIRVIGKKAFANCYRQKVLTRYRELNDKKMIRKVLGKIFLLEPNLLNLLLLINNDKLLAFEKTSSHNILKIFGIKLKIKMKR